MFWYQGTLIEEVGVQIPVEVIYSLLTSNFQQFSVIALEQNLFYVSDLTQKNWIENY